MTMVSFGLKDQLRTSEYSGSSPRVNEQKRVKSSVGHKPPSPSLMARHTVDAHWKRPSDALSSMRHQPLLGHSDSRLEMPESVISMNKEISCSLVDLLMLSRCLQKTRWLLEKACEMSLSGRDVMRIRKLAGRSVALLANTSRRVLR